MNDQLTKDNLPRCKHKALGALGTKFYKELKTKHPKLNELHNNDIKNIIKIFNKKVQKGIIENRDGVELPESLGRIFIGSWKFKNDRRAIDKYQSKIQKKRVYHRNMETDGNMCKIIHTTYMQKFVFANSMLYSFKAQQCYSREVSKHFIVNWKMYIPLSNNIQKFRQTMKKLEYKEKICSKNNEELKTYNEFEL
jgi:hypothetical protein